VNSTCASSTNGSITITATGGRAPYTYLLNGISQTTNIFTGLGAGSYSIEVKDANGCSVFQTTTISAPNGFDVDLTSSDLVIGRGDVVTLTATNTSSLPIIAYDWSPLSIVTCTNSSCSIVSSSPIETTLYTVTAMNSDSCTSTDTITVIVRQDKAVFIPSAFTPNGDGKNDNFDFQILGAKNVAVSIWDRWGENVYQNANQQNDTKKRRAATAELVAREYTEVDGGSRRRKTRRRKMRKNKTRSKRRKHTKRHRK
jgi:gliding motility-associated-like protein